ncbi:MAG: diaminopimelate decarboxylase [Pseudanabaenaceae cyanobacterium]
MVLSPNQQLLPLTAITNSRGHLEIGGCEVAALAQQYGTPLYIVDELTVRAACRQYRDGFREYYPGQSQVLYASKAWSCLAICAIAGSEGLGMDIVSAGELFTALQAGITPQLIYFHGNNKSPGEIQAGIEAGVTIVIDNWQELKILASQTKPVRVMVRLTPGIECHTHEYIRTGHLDSKFGFDPQDMEQVFSLLSHTPHLHCVGLHAHIGSQIFELQPHQDIGAVMAQWYQLAQQKYGLQFTELNIGGGLGVRYIDSDDPPTIGEWVQAVSVGVIQSFQALNLPLPKLLCEPGRSIVANACVTAYTVGSQKTVPHIRTYIAVDGGMSDNPRPITYQSKYSAVVANKMLSPLSQKVTIAGKHCESGDVLISDIALPAVETGDILVVLVTGAYNYSMASNYNRLPRPCAVLVGDGDSQVILKRETNADLLRQDCLPERLRLREA